MNNLGRIFHLESSPNRSNHCQVPTPFVFDTHVRVYYACRNNGKSFPAYFDLDKNDLTKVLKVHESPVMELGPLGSYDSDGIMPSCVVRNGDELWMYYTAWNARVSVGYHNCIGLAVSDDGGETFKQRFDGPIMDRTRNEGGIHVTPFVMKHGLHWFMQYISGASWNYINGKPEPVYVIKSASSKNGYEWHRHNVQNVPSYNDFEAFSNPCLHNGKIYFCYRDSLDYRNGKGSYKIGMWDGEVRHDNIIASEGEWDSVMRCYPYVIDINEKTYMFYNGNSFGQTGIGLAVLDD